MKKILLSILLSGLPAWQAGAQTHTDDFNRANTGITANGTTLGNADYVVTSINNDPATGLQILGNTMTGSGNGSPAGTVLSYQGFTLQQGFTVSAVLQAGSFTNRQFGVAFNYQNNNNFYYARLSGDSLLQVVRCVNGTETAVSAFTLPSTLQINTPYTLTVTSTSAYNFTVTLVGGSLNYGQSVTDSDSSFTGGYAGAVWSVAHNNALVDSLTISTVEVTAPFFSDNFNRADVAATTSGTALGNASYGVTSANSDPATGVQIASNAAAGPGVPGPSFIALSYQGFALNSANFTVSAVLKATSTLAATGQQWGVVWNFQDNNDFYWARISSATQLQIGKMVNGTATANTFNLGGTAVFNTPYTMTISSTANYNFSVSLVGGGINFSNSYADAGNSFTGGYGGALWSTPQAHLRVDSLSITTAMVPTETAYEIWANGYGIDPTPAGFLSDDDKDGMTALEEFAFNLNPTISDRKTYDPAAVGPPAGLPRFTVSATPLLSITYLRRKNVPELSYQVEFGGTLGDFQNSVGAPLVEPIEGNADWETVTVADDAGAGQPRRFGRVTVLSSAP